MTLFFILPHDACVIMTQLNRWIILKMVIRVKKWPKKDSLTQKKASFLMIFNSLLPSTPMVGTTLHKMGGCGCRRVFVFPSNMANSSNWMYFQSGHDNPSIYHYGTKEWTPLEQNQAEITASPTRSGRGEVKEKVISHLSEFFESTNQPSVNPSLCFSYSPAFHKHNRIWVDTNEIVVTQRV